MECLMSLLALATALALVQCYPTRGSVRRRYDYPTSAGSEGEAIGDRTFTDTKSGSFNSDAHDNLRSWTSFSGSASGSGSSRYNSFGSTRAGNRFAQVGSGGFSNGDATSVSGAHAADSDFFRSRLGSSSGSACAGAKACDTGTRVYGQTEQMGIKAWGTTGGRGDVTSGTSNSGLGINGGRFNTKTQAGGRSGGRGYSNWESSAHVRFGGTRAFYGK